MYPNVGIMLYNEYNCRYYVYRKIGDLWIIILKVLTLDHPETVKNPHLESQKRYLSISVNISPNS